MLAPYLQIEQQLYSRALQRLQHDEPSIFAQLEKERQQQEGYHEKQAPDPTNSPALAYSIKKFSFYLCFECKTPYYGGDRE